MVPTEGREGDSWRHAGDDRVQNNGQFKLANMNENTNFGETPQHQAGFMGYNGPTLVPMPHLEIKDERAERLVDSSSGEDSSRVKLTNQNSL